MSKHSTLITSLTAILTCALAPTLGRRCAVAQVSQMEQTAVVCPVDAEHAQPLALGREVLGSRACFACHLQGTASFAIDPDISKIVGAEFLSRAVHDNWVLGNEWRTWSISDRHAQAYTTLLGERSARIGKILGIAEVNRDARCLACHSSLPAASLQRDGNAVDIAYFAADHVDERAALGVNCEACHGAAGTHGAAGAANARSGWIQDHVASQTWRYKAPAEKQDGFGFYDVRTPSSRAAMCLSCHLGDARQGRLVTHAMYAAGHPPLPSFELKSFADMMPAHWRDLGSDAAVEPQAANPATLLGKKPKSITADFLAKTADPYFRNVEKQHPDFFAGIVENYDECCPATRTLTVGALVAWVKNAELTRELMSAREYPMLSGEGRWPELSQFECSACHHELRQADWRQDDNAAAPGRPMLRHWSSPLCQAVLKALASDQVAGFEERQREIDLDVAAQPYGNPTLLDQRLADAAARLEGIAKEIEARPFSRTEAVAVLRAVAEAGAARPLDYDAARQLAWAAAAALEEVAPGQRWPAVRDRLDTLQQHFVLDLATVNVRKETQFKVPGAGDRSAYEIDLATLLPAMANHSGREVREAFEQLAEAVRGDPP